MHTKKQIKELLEAQSAMPNKRLGQNFLIDLNLMKLLIASARIKPEDTVLEVGCGTGSLTQGLAETGTEIIGVELDKNLYKTAVSQTKDYSNVNLINDDILAGKNEISPMVISAVKSVMRKQSGRFLLVANLPYQAASPLIINLIAGDIKVDAMFVTVQKEVAYRLAAAANSKHYGILAILAAATGDLKIERVLKPCVFWPSPKVDSAFVSYTRNSGKIGRIKDLDLFRQLVSGIMNHRRKMLKSCVKHLSGDLGGITEWREIFEQVQIDAFKRPQQLSCDDIKLENVVYKQL
jgi:16S rRNA (adenine1518-N6/adenine1519-N6)-dimethyltransferase